MRIEVDTNPKLGPGAEASGGSDEAPDAQRPIFISGPDRSGTTLTYALLASHPDLSMVRRTNMWRYFDRRFGDLSDTENLDRCLDSMIGFRRMRHLDPDRERIRREFLEGPATYGHLFALFHLHHAERSGRSRWGDKSLHTEHHADRIFEEFPDARVVHMLRDPRDRYASIRNRWGRDESRLANATGRWLASTRAAQRNVVRYPDRFMILRYEDLARAPETSMREVCRFVDLPYAPVMLEMQGVPEHREHGGNSSYGDRPAGTISTSSIGRFREKLPPEEIAFVDRAVRREMAAFGYRHADIGLPFPQRARFWLWGYPLTAARMRTAMALEDRTRRRGEPVPADKVLHLDPTADREDTP